MTIGTTGDLEMCRRAPVVEEFPKMLTRQRLTVLLGLGLIGCILLGNACDVVNPEFAYQMGGNPIPGSTNVNGYVLVVLNNLTPHDAMLTYEADIKRVGQADLVSDSGTLFKGPGEYLAISLSCGTQEIRLVSLDLGIDLDIEALDETQDGEAAPTTFPIDLPTTVVTSPVLRCGSVVIVTVVGTGADAVADVQVLN